MKKSKKAWILGFMCVSLCAAIYLNWFFNSRETGKNLGEGMFVSNSSVIGSEEDIVADYFANARLERKNAHDREAATLNEIINNENSTEEAKTQASDELVTLTKSNGHQAAIESLVLAKGYSDCLAYVGKEHVTVVINKPALEQADVVVIKDIVTKETGIPASGVQVFEAKIAGTSGEEISSAGSDEGSASDESVSSSGLAASEQI